MKIVDDTPLVSVIVPVYNVETYLKRCIESILNQTYKNLEIILINDGSTDDSGNISAKFEKEYSNILLIHQENGGLSAARNTGLNIYSGDYVIFVDSDDWLREDMISSLLKFALQNNLELVECDILNSQDLNKPTVTKTPSTFIENQTEAMSRLLTNNNFSVWRRIYSKAIIKDRRFIPNKINEDVFFTIDSINSITKQGYIEDKLYVYNTENISITRSPYSLKKLDAKDALYHIVKHTKNYDNKIRTIAKQYLLRGLINHYNPLFTHSNLDPNYEYRVQLRKEIKAQRAIMKKERMPSGLRSFEKLLLVLPIPLYGLYVRLNQLRIDYRVKQFKSLHV